MSVRTILQRSGGGDDNFHPFAGDMTPGSLHVIIAVSHDNVAITLSGALAASYTALPDHQDAGNGRHFRCFYRRNVPAAYNPGPVTSPALNVNAGATMAVYSRELSGFPEDVANDPFVAEAFEPGSSSSAPSVAIDPDVEAAILFAFGDWNDGGYSLAPAAGCLEDADNVATRGTDLGTRLDAAAGPQSVGFVMTSGPKANWSLLAVAFANGVDPPAFTYGTPAFLVAGAPIAPLSPTNSGGDVDAGSWYIDESAGDPLPNGLSIDADTGDISGTPTQYGTFDVVPTGLNVGGLGFFNLRIVVTGAAGGTPSISYATPQEIETGVVAHIHPSNTGSRGTYALQAGTLPSGTSLNPNTGEILGSPDTIEDQSATVRCTTGLGAFDDFDIDFSVYTRTVGTVRAINTAGQSDGDAEIWLFANSGAPTTDSPTTPAPADSAGFHSLLAFWAGGAGSPQAPTSPAPTSVPPTTEAPTTPEPTTPEPTTPEPTTPEPTTDAPTTPEPTTPEPTTQAPTTPEPTTPGPSTDTPTEPPETDSPTTETPTTEAPTSETPTSETPSTEAPTTAETPAARKEEVEMLYHVHSDFTIVSAVDGRTGQLASGAIAGGDSLELGNLLNTIRVRPGDKFRLVTDSSKLSSTSAEAAVVNDGEFTVDSVEGSELTFEEEMEAEPNSSDSFFEFTITRPSPYEHSTFARVNQEAFEPAVFINGAAADVTVTELDDEGVLVESDFGSMKFLPLGSNRWSIETRLAVDGNIEVVIPDDGPDVELRLTNMNVIQDAQLALFRNDPRLFGPHVASALTTSLRLQGERFVRNETTGTDLELLSLEPNTSQATAGTSCEVLMTVRDRKMSSIPNLEGSLIFMEIRSADTNSVVVYKEASWLATGLVRGLIAPEESQAGVYYLSLEVHRGGVPAKIMRTNRVLFRILP